MDEIDRRRARRLAWRVLGPGEDPSVDLEDLTPEQQEREARVALGPQVARVWALGPGRDQERGVVELVDQAMGLGHSLSYLPTNQAVTLFRLLVRHWEVLAPDQRHTVRRLPDTTFATPELALLLAEVAATGNDALAVVIESGLGEQELELTGLARVLGGIVERPLRPEAARLAVRWLGLCPPQESRRWLRATLRLPSLALRAEALSVLATDPESMRDEDVLWLLADAIDHPLPRGFYDASRQYLDDLRAVALVRRPAGGAEIVRRLLGRGDDGEEPDQAWSLGLLAAAWPDVAAPLIDERFDSPRGWDVVAAFIAAESLPDALARPRFLRAAATGDPWVRKHARAAWLARFSEPCPAPLAAGVDPSLVSAGSAWVDEQVEVLFGSDLEGAAQRAIELLAAAPDPEALGLLLLFAGGAPRQPGLPADPVGWLTALVRGWGSLAIGRIAALACRERRVWGGWTSALVDAYHQADPPIPASVVQAVLRDALRTGRVGSRDLVLDSFGRVGLPQDLVPALLDELLAGDESSAWVLQGLLSKVPAPPGGPERLRAAIDRLLLSDDPLLGRLTPVAIAWGDPATRASLTAAIERAGEGVEPPEWALAAIYRLLAAGWLDEDWRLAALERPERARFTLAQIGLSPGLTEPQHERLVAALGSPGRAGASAVEAVAALIAAGRIPLDDPRIEPIAMAAPPGAGAWLVLAFLGYNPRAGAKHWPAWAHAWGVREVLGSAAAREQFGMCVEHPEVAAVLEEALGRLAADDPAADTLREALDLDVDDQYWVE